MTISFHVDLESFYFDKIDMAFYKGIYEGMELKL